MFYVVQYNMWDFLFDIMSGWGCNELVLGLRLEIQLLMMIICHFITYSVLMVFLIGLLCILVHCVE